MAAMKTGVLELAIRIPLVKYIALIVLIAASAFRVGAQEPAKAYTFDCTKLSFANQSQGCESYNEMVVKGDKDITGAFQSSSASDVLVCFRPAEDVFFVISYKVPDDAEYHRANTPNIFEAVEFLFYSRYKDGVLDTSGLSYGAWTKIPNIAVSFSAKDKDGSYASINSSEVSYGSSFLNLNNTKTLYTVQIRLSTLRFSETYTFQEAPPPKPAKSPAPPTPPSQNRIEYTGYCAAFKPRAPL